MNEKKLKNCLREINFDMYYFNIYVYILKEGDVQFSVLNNKSDDKKCLRDSLIWLQKKGFILITLAENNIESIHPINPKIAFSAHFSKFLWDYIPNISQSYRLNKNERCRILSFKKCCDFLIKEASILYKNQELDHEIISITDGDKLGILLSDIINDSNEIIRGITIQSWLPNIALIWGSIRNKIEKGVIYKRISDLKTLVSFGYKINKRDTEEVGVKLRILDKNRLDEKYYIIDKDKLLIFEPSYEKNQFEIKGTLTKNLGITKRYINKFELMWNDGIDVKEILDYMNNIRIEMCSVLDNKFLDNDLIKKLFFGIFDYGIFFKKEYIKCSEKLYNNYIEQLTNHKLIIPVDHQSHSYIPNIVDDIQVWINNKNQ